MLTTQHSLDPSILLKTHIIGRVGRIKAFVTSFVLANAPTYLTAQVTHSTLADTVGMDAELRIIEAHLGKLNAGIRDHLVALPVQYFTFKHDGTFDKTNLVKATGILVLHDRVADEVSAIFEEFLRDTFPINKVIPVNCYGLNADSTGWNDDASMADNNTSAFNYRKTPATKDLSNHSYGMAIDINPMLNPLVRTNTNGKIIKPANGNYEPTQPGTLTWKYLAPLLVKRNWFWGGRWPQPKDYQHIEKNRKCARLEQIGSPKKLK